MSKYGGFASILVVVGKVVGQQRIWLFRRQWKGLIEKILFAVNPSGIGHGYI